MIEQGQVERIFLSVFQVWPLGIEAIPYIDIRKSYAKREDSGFKVVKVE